MKSDKAMMFVKQIAYINSEIQHCETEMRDHGIDIDGWACRKKAFEDMKKKLIEK